jgi:hypothetical protein
MLPFEYAHSVSPTIHEMSSCLFLIGQAYKTLHTAINVPGLRTHSLIVNCRIPTCVFENGG